MKRIPCITLALAAIALICGAMPTLADGLEFSREAFARGEIWRLFTAHFVHFGGAHLRWDVLALLLLGSMAEWKSRRDWVAAVVVSAPAIVLAVWWALPQFAVYRGLSGIDCAAYGVVAGHLLREGWRGRAWEGRTSGRPRRWSLFGKCPPFGKPGGDGRHGDRPVRRDWFSLALGVAACAGAAAKCGYEVVTGNMVFVGAAEAFAAVPLAHVVGVAVGVMVAIFGRWMGRVCFSAFRGKGGGAVSTSPRAA